MPTILQIDDVLFNGAKGIIESGQEHAPIILAFPTDAAMPRVLGVGPLLMNDEGASIVSRMISATMATGEYDVVAFLSEGWRVTVTDGQSKTKDLIDAGVRPAAHPDREETLTITYSLRGGERALADHTIVTTDGKRRLERGKLVFGADVMSGRFFAGEAA